jgi:hypothetical protein
MWPASEKDHLWGTYDPQRPALVSPARIGLRPLAHVEEEDKEWDIEMKCEEYTHIYIWNRNVNLQIWNECRKLSQRIRKQTLCYLFALLSRSQYAEEKTWSFSVLKVSEYSLCVSIETCISCFLSPIGPCFQSTRRHRISTSAAKQLPAYDRGIRFQFSTENFCDGSRGMKCWGYSWSFTTTEHEGWKHLERGLHCVIDLWDMLLNNLFLKKYFIAVWFILIVTAYFVPSKLILCTVKMKTTRSSETSILTRPKMCHILEDGILYI